MNLNIITLFDSLLDWNSTVSLVLMIIGLLLLALLIVSLIVWLIKLAHRDPAPEEERAARRERIVVKEPSQTRVVVVQRSVEPQVVYVQQPQPAEPQVVYVQQPQPAPQQVPAPQPVVQQVPVSELALLPVSEEEGDFDDEEEDIIEESFEGGVVRYNRSFMAKYIQSTDETKDFYVHLKNKLLSHLKVRSRISWKRESFSFGRVPFARFVFRGKTLCLCLPLDPAQFAESKYNVEDVSNVALYADTPCLYRIRSDRRLNYAYELIDFVAQNIGTVESNRHYEDFYMPYEGIVQLIDKGLVKRVIRRNDKSYIESR